jgi:acyl carrier protein
MFGVRIDDDAADSWKTPGDMLRTVERLTP